MAKLVNFAIAWNKLSHQELFIWKGNLYTKLSDCYAYNHTTRRRVCFIGREKTMVVTA